LPWPSLSDQTICSKRCVAIERISDIRIGNLLEPDRFILQQFLLNVIRHYSPFEDIDNEIWRNRLLAEAINIANGNWKRFTRWSAFKLENLSTRQFSRKNLLSTIRHSPSRIRIVLITGICT